jgi:peptidoglycan/xylan/chitin deacetylase (PgdA/CDA1 family)
MSCIVALWICGAGLLFLNTILSNNNSARALITHNTEQKVVTIPTPSPTHAPTPSPTPIPTPIPTASPITPFPTSLAAEVAMMQNNNRFFYHGNTLLPEVALTFDDGPNPPYTSQILAILRNNQIKASFFCVGGNAQKYPYLVKQEYQQGHIIGNHTWSHPYMPNLSPASITWQFTTTSHMLEHITGIYPTFFRPPYGAYSQPTLQYANEHGMSVFLWNDDPQDWARPGVQTIVYRALSEASNGGIILLHDGGGDRSQTVAALPLIIDALRARGYSFVTLKQLVEHNHQPTTTQTPVPQGTPPPIIEPTTVISKQASDMLPTWKPEE